MNVIKGHQNDSAGLLANPICAMAARFHVRLLFQTKFNHKTWQSGLD